MRLDKFCAENFGSRTKAANAIDSGLVLVNGKVVAASYILKDTDEVSFLESKESYVSAGGYKLSKALKDFSFSVEGKIFADIGASTGGFTDCLLQNGASKVYCVDVGESQLHESLRKKNIVIIDNFNARNLTGNLFSDKLDGAVIDVSFISLTYILGGVANILENGGTVIALIKPQFECESRSVGKNGIVKEPAVHKKIIEKIYTFANNCNLSPKQITNAPIIKNKNLEYLILLEKEGKSLDIKELIKSVKL